MTDFEKEMKHMEDLALKCVEAAEGLRKQVERIMGVKEPDVGSIHYHEACPSQNVLTRRCDNPFRLHCPKHTRKYLERESGKSSIFCYVGKKG